MTTLRHLGCLWFAGILVAVLLNGCDRPTVPPPAPKSQTPAAPLTDETVVTSEPAPTALFDDEPAAHALYDRMVQAMRDADSLSYVSRCRWEGAGEPDGGICRVWLKKPNYFRVETEPAAEGKSRLLLEGLGGVLIGDGHTMWTHWPKGRPPFWPEEETEADRQTRFSSYMKKPAPPGTISLGHEVLFVLVMHVLDISTFHGYTDCLQEYLDGVRSLGTEKVGDEDCDAIEISFLAKRKNQWAHLSHFVGLGGVE